MSQSLRSGQTIQDSFTTEIVGLWCRGGRDNRRIEAPISRQFSVDSLMINISHVPGFVFDLEKPSLKPEEMQDTVLVFLRQPLGCGPPRSPTHSLTRLLWTNSVGETYSIDDGYGYTDEPSASHHDPHATHKLVRNRPWYFAGWRQQLGPSSQVQEECGREPSPSWTELSGK